MADSPDPAAATADRPAEAALHARAGCACGDGARSPVDAPRLDPIWVACAELRCPVKVHVAAFRFFERGDEGFNPRPWPEEPDPVAPAPGRWCVSGLALPEPTLAAPSAEDVRHALEGLRPASRAG